MAAKVDATVADLRRTIAELRAELDAREAELSEALERQTATAEILRVISRSPTDVQPTFDATAAATRLTDAPTGGVFRFDGLLIHSVAHHGLTAAELDARHRDFPRPLNRGSAAARAIMTGDVAHIADMAADSELAVSANVQAGFHTLLAVPMLRDGNPIGTINVARRKVELFTDQQIDLLKTFADQAVIAIENVRLFNELNERTGDLQESLEYQTAPSDVLNVISRSAFDLQPILETVVATAARLCRAEKAILYRYENGAYRFAAGLSNEPEYERIERETLIFPGEGTVAGRAALHKRAVQIVDPLADPLYESKDEARIGKARSMVGVPLLREGSPIGVIALARERVEPFTDRQIGLVQTFADQAVIAMENARLITETREALEQQTATAEVLQVINSSPGDLAPVFDAILEKAMALCDVAYGDLELYDGDTFRAVATRGLTDAFDEQVRRGYPAGDNPATRPLIAGERVSHIVNMAEVDFSKVFTHEPVEHEGHHTLLCVPLRRENHLLGMIACARGEVRAFSEKEIALLENFAAQAVIAMENARLITETREALDQQTATAEVLGVINSSPGDLTPVFDAMLDKAMRLLGAALGALYTYDGETFTGMTYRGVSPELTQSLREPARPHPGGLLARLVEGNAFAQVEDLSKTEAYRAGNSVARQMVDALGARTVLVVALRKDRTLLGYLGFHRQEVRSFTDKQIALLQNFAAQAVIAMENARLLTETREALDQQTATAEVLQVINSSPGDLAPVFDAMLEKAVRLCEATFGILWGYDDDAFRAAALHGVPIPLVEYLREPLRPGPGTSLARMIAGEPLIHVIDVTTDETYRAGDPGRRALADLGGARTALTCALRMDDKLLGVFTVYRNTVRPFSAKQIALLQNFAAQAVIAIENTRLITETREARDDAEAALGHLKAAQANLIQAEKMASLGQLTAGIAHEIKNPLNFVNNFASLSNELLGELKGIAAPALETLGEDKRAELDETFDMLTGNLEKIAEHGRRADNIVKSMLAHSRGGSGERQMVDLNALLEESLNLAYHGARAQDQSFNITLERDFDHTLKPIELVPQDMTRVFLNLFGNGFYAANKRPHANGEAGFRPLLRVTTRDQGDSIEVTVHDNGTGIPPEIRDKLFQPFFTTKPTGEGTGLGLSISYDIVTQQHSGTIAVDSRLGEYTEFTIRLPRGARPAIDRTAANGAATPEAATSREPA